jgi:hypothetical protein
MWPAFLIGLLSEWFDETNDIGRFVLKGFASGVTGVLLNVILWALLSQHASSLVGSWNNLSVEFFLVPFVVAFVALIIVKSARYFSKMSFTGKQ